MLSLHDGIAAVSPQGRVVLRAPLEGAGALCVNEHSLFCADQSGTIWQFDRATMMPRTLGSGGPGICSMCLSPCGTRLYALLGDADSLLMSDAQNGRPLVVNRCGCNPRMMRYGKGKLIAAGGESGCMHVYHAQTLEELEVIPMPGPVYSVILCDDILYALCLTAQLNTLLAVRKDGRLHTIALPGMPGCLSAAADGIYAAVQGKMYVFSKGADCLISMRDAPGRASKLFVLPGQIVLYDPLSECVYAAVSGGRWRCICSAVRDVCMA